ncbi:DUF5327 family protein [Halalkalibacter kiskunsagensis]|uniref:DUF5327 family protein n=1 Tax=Halalkalibacter kiskunsagensis TaxID=1548599 RepID=A0ABV6KEA6_9BACI
MNIPAKQICDHIDTQVSKLRKAVADGDRVSMRETTAVIEAYCQLLKGTAAQTQNQIAEAAPVKEYQAPEQPMTLQRPLVTHSENEVGEKHNLLDF